MEACMSGESDRDRPSRPTQQNPGDQAPEGTPGTGENVCRHCRGTGRMPDGARCEECGGTGRVIEEIGGA
jgi:DnaJ-class molecular chaperone